MTRPKIIRRNGGDRMSAREREDLTKLLRNRERVLKSKAKERSAELRATAEQHIAAIYHFDEDETWDEAYRILQAETRRANERVAERCRELGIPRDFAPSINTYWNSRGQTAVAERRAELRKVAVAQIEAMERKAFSKIEELSLAAQTAVVAHGIESRAARDFLEAMPPLAQLMPPLEMDAIQALLPGGRRQTRRMLLESGRLDEEAEQHDGGHGDD